MKKLIAIAALAAATISTASAQMRFGPEVGLNLTSIQTKVDGTSDNSDMKIGARFGAVADIPMTANLYLRPGIQFSMMGGKKEVKEDFFGTTYTYTSTVTLNYIQVPVNILYKFGEEGGGRFYVGLTPYLGFGISGTAKVKFEGESESEKIKFGSGDDADVKAMDFGAGLKLGYELPMGLYFDVAFLQGLSNNVPKGDSDHKMTNRNITIGIGYLFGGK